MYRIDAPGINNAFQIDNFYFGGQPDEQGLQYFIDQGVTRIYNLRSAGEFDHSEHEQFLKAKDIPYHFLPFFGAESFNDECIKVLGELAQGPSEEKVLIHCASGNRIGAWYIIYLVKSKGMSFEDAQAEGLKAGLTNPGLLEAVKAYLEN